jgi:hypothetical protein
VPFQRYPSPSEQRQLHRLAMAIWQLSPILQVKYVPFICWEFKPTNVNQLMALKESGTALPMMASEVVVANQNTAAGRITPTVALNQQNSLRQEPSELHGSEPGTKDLNAFTPRILCPSSIDELD